MKKLDDIKLDAVYWNGMYSVACRLDDSMTILATFTTKLDANECIIAINTVLEMMNDENCCDS